MAIAATLGFPRMGPRRELKRALESFWQGKSTEAELGKAAADIRRLRWQLQKEAGIDWIPSNDFSLYDHVLDMAVLFDAVPDRFRGLPDGSLAQYFAMARGAEGVAALEMTKWFDTNYHYLVPEFSAQQNFRLRANKPLAEYLEARQLGIETVPVLLGPVSFLRLGKVREQNVEPLSLMAQLLPAYGELLNALHDAGVQWVQIDEPCLVLDLTDSERSSLHEAYTYLAAQSVPNMLLTTYFGSIADNLETALSLPVQGLHLDLVRAPQQLAELARYGWPQEKRLSVGVIDGRNIWRADLHEALVLVEQAASIAGLEQVHVAPSCSLLHAPWDVELESDMEPEVKSWLAFAVQKLSELRVLKRGANDGKDAIAEHLALSREARRARTASPRLRNSAVATRMAQLSGLQLARASSFAERKSKQQERLQLPPFPTTTIGSFPQTQSVRDTRAKWRKGQISDAEYELFLQGEIMRWIVIQEELGLDVLVHGEFERTDMVEHFGEKLDGFLFTRHGWVQSYGSRCVKPPIIVGDVARPEPMTVRWTSYAQSLTERPVKGMLTGPVTILQWSFVRDDLPRHEVCRQIALAIRDEVLDLEAAGIRVIQIDEPALREGLPLRRADWDAYLEWAVECFHIAASGVKDETQIHTHMCYAEFHDIMPAIQAMDADVISIETSRSHMELLQAFEAFQYTNDIGPGVYDIHSPRVPDVHDMVGLLRKAASVIDPAQLWVNPDCGLKTRGEAETLAALQAMVMAARQLRQEPVTCATSIS
ncbi:5-methyltetrahydropteroyltriglutamate--homocysteine methyltransferase [Alicyclobacillus hesperidum subsp. aegles]|uniref:5-methyltetrahydropteroyltriglutamate-- homocysteine S-methyltransferase n=1 Tax=Alicyclobacillus hesperidum TaxID=89784 RepID=UPI0009F8A09B|nr:5-methyltetrahydropteroyltriglutamate--homocysteine S-methyltransferase [Alicyclobacillus hesperidum]GLG02335.1 5-methyltetrahydropteroyltriglutamate--homocysteine methyltransferase [Alicyclobacillus hesperidum subsp. aegles]